MKSCSKCGIEKSLEEFPFDTNFSVKKYPNKDKKKSECLECCKIRHLGYRIKKGQKYNSHKKYLNDKSKKRLKEAIQRTEKECNKCHQVKLLSSFPELPTFNKTGKRNASYSFDGRGGTCKECIGLYNKSRRPPPKIRLTQEEIKQKNRERARLRYANDLEHREKRKQEARLSHQLDRSKMLARKHKREAIIINQHDGTVDSKTINTLLRERKSCIYCGQNYNGNKPEIDHIDPLSKGGLHSKNNLTSCCYNCNRTKANKSFVEWLEFIKNERKEIVKKFYFRRLHRYPEQSFLKLKYNS